MFRKHSLKSIPGEYSNENEILEHSQNGIPAQLS